MSYCSILLPDAAELRLTRVISESDFLAVEVEVALVVVPCPGCGRVCLRRHSYYVRTLADLPSHGVRVQLRLRTRKFFCDARACSRRIFTERLPRTAAPYARCSLRLSEALRNIGFVAGAERPDRLPPVGVSRTARSPGATPGPTASLPWLLRVSASPYRRAATRC